MKTLKCADGLGLLQHTIGEAIRDLERAGDDRGAANYAVQRVSRLLFDNEVMTDVIEQSCNWNVIPERLLGCLCEMYIVSTADEPELRPILLKALSFVSSEVLP